MTAKQSRPKKCRVCRETYTPRKPLQVVCSPNCALLHAKQKRERERKALAKIERKAIREAKERVKPRSEYMKEAQVVINRYVRLRDAHLGCVSCERPATWQGQWHASHFRSRGAAPHLRFNLHNIHKACSICNNHLSGNIAGYRPRLIKKIGLERVEWLESNHSRAGHDIEYLKRLKAIFNKKANRLELRLAGDQSWTAM